MRLVGNNSSLNPFSNAGGFAVLMQTASSECCMLFAVPRKLFAICLLLGGLSKVGADPAVVAQAGEAEWQTDLKVQETALPVEEGIVR